MRKLLIACFVLFSVCLHAQDTAADTTLKTSVPKQSVFIPFLERYIHASLPTENGAPAGRYTVTIRFMVDTTGKISDVRVETDPGYGMGEDVVKAFKHRLRWPPATRNGQKVAYRQKQNIVYFVSR